MKLLVSTFIHDRTSKDYKRWAIILVLSIILVDSMYVTLKLCPVQGVVLNRGI
jgi:hypothetical protein